MVGGRIALGNRERMGKSRRGETNGAGPAAPQPGGGAERPLASYFLSLSLENVRCFSERQTLDLSDGNGKPARWTIVFGVNGTGKTTILQGLAGFETWPELATARLFEYWKHTITGLRDDTDAPALWRVEVAHSSNLHTKVTTRNRMRFTLHHDFDNEMVPREESHNVHATDPWCCGYGASRRLGMAYLTGTGGTDDPAGSLFSDEADLRNPEEWLLQLDYTASKIPSAESTNRLAQVKELLLGILLEIKDLRFVIPSGPTPRPRVEFKTYYGWVPLRQLGYGYQTLITWVADLVSRMVERYPDSPNPLAEPAVVLVDEIDLHLHPVWQRKLMGYLTERFPNTQFIATAHSPLVAQAAADANLAVLRREGDHVVIDNDVDDIRNWRIDQILTSDLFGLETARPPQMEAALLERRELLSKSRPSAADKKRLQELEAQIGELPMGETRQEIEEREQIRQALELLKRERKAGR